MGCPSISFEPSGRNVSHAEIVMKYLLGSSDMAHSGSALDLLGWRSSVVRRSPESELHVRH